MNVSLNNRLYFTRWFTPVQLTSNLTIQLGADIKCCTGLRKYHKQTLERITLPNIVHVHCLKSPHFHHASHRPITWLLASHAPPAPACPQFYLFKFILLCRYCRMNTLCTRQLVRPDCRRTGCRNIIGNVALVISVRVAIDEIRWWIKMCMCVFEFQFHYRIRVSHENYVDFGHKGEIPTIWWSKWDINIIACI